MMRSVFNNTMLNMIGSCALLISLTSCSVSRRMSAEAMQDIITDSSLASAHVGICLFDATGNKYLYNYQGDKYFIPASNTKIFTCYMAMKYLGDSLVGLRYKLGTDGTVYIEPSGDPTLLHPDFKNQPVFEFLKKFKTIHVEHPYFTDEYEGLGWSWDDYKDYYMAQRSNLPVYGNIMRIAKEGNGISISPPAFSYIIAEGANLDSGFRVNKEWDKNDISIFPGHANYLEVPFTPNINEICSLLSDTLHAKVLPDFAGTESAVSVIHSQPTDSLLKIMMHRSDNFYAEQSLLMVSNERLGWMNDEAIIDTLLKTDLKDLPQRPQWVDGSGLSRFDLFSPQDFVFILNRMKNEYGWQKITTIFETGGTGTLGGYYKNLAGKIYAKTGSLSNDIALSGYLITQKNKTLIFSILVNNHHVSATAVRRAVERFLTQVQQKY
ncbi:MAG TPA: D-alanyl-D-alanine carboxypeptidase [Chitinophagaceae bacterium]|nr:D-alanyl-D-alanine carboxypeptidase [Chitinophagaceae bacterium]